MDSKKGQSGSNIRYHGGNNYFLQENDSNITFSLTSCSLWLNTEVVRTNLQLLYRHAEGKGYIPCCPTRQLLLSRTKRTLWFINTHHSFVSLYIPHHYLSTPVMSQDPEQKQGGCWPEAVQLLEVNVPEQTKQWRYFLKLYSCIIWETRFIYGIERRQSTLLKGFCVSIASAYWLGVTPKEILNESIILQTPQPSSPLGRKCIKPAKMLTFK